MTTTLPVNTLACLLLGWLAAARHRLHAHLTHLAAVGFCGGLSTFSSFVRDLARLADGPGAATAVAAGALEIAVGLGAAALGLFIGHRLHGCAER